MESSKLKLNDDKTEAKLSTIGTRSSASVSCGNHFQVGDILVPFKPKAKNLGVVLDSSLTMCEHISVCRSAHLELRKISAICPFLPKDVSAILVCARV